jgi:translation elongation factor EF-Ts
LNKLKSLKKYTGVSYSVAKEALEATEGDLLEAVILLEKQQKLHPQPENTNFRTDRGEEEKVVVNKKPKKRV